MPLDSEIFEMLERDALLSLDRDRLEAELERARRMLYRVIDYQRTVLAALLRAEPGSAATP